MRVGLLLPLAMMWFLGPLRKASKVTGGSFLSDDYLTFLTYCSFIKKVQMKIYMKHDYNIIGKCKSK